MLRYLFRSRYLWFALIFATYVFVSYTTLDPDFGWHLRSGEYFLAHGIPATDIYTYTAASFPWIDHEWLHDVLTALLYNAGGYVLLSLVFAALWTAGLLIAGRRALLPLVVLAALATLPFAGVRTVTWSFVLLPLTVWLLDRRMRWWPFIPVLFLAWANLHGSFVIGLGVVFYLAVVRRSWRVALVGLVSAAVTFINPYGPQLYVEVWRTLSDPALHTQIREWQPARLSIICLPYLLLWAGTFVVADGKRWRAYGGMDVIAALASIWSVRNTPLFAALSLPALDRRARLLLARIPATLDRPRRRFLRGLSIGATAFVLILCVRYFWSFGLDREAGYPRDAVQVLANQPCSGNLFNLYGDGGYLIWKLPNEKVYIDGRMPSWQHSGVRYLDDYSRIFKDRAFQRAQFAQYGITCALLRPSTKPLVTDLVDDGWTRQNLPDGSVLLRKG